MHLTRQHGLRLASCAGSPSEVCLSLRITLRCQKFPSLTRSNCRAIEVPVYETPATSPDEEHFEPFFGDHPMSPEGVGQMPGLLAARRDESQPYGTTPSTTPKHFPFLELPLELRLKVYGILLPPRTHKIVTQVPYNGFFYGPSSSPVGTTQTFYPVDKYAPRSLTTYKVISSNTHPSFPHPSFCTEILRVCRRIRDEAEPLLYGAKGVSFDFGTYLEAARAFWADRSETARRSARQLSVAKAIPCSENGGEMVDVDESWNLFCSFLHQDLPGLRVLDLTIWSSTGSKLSLSSPSHLSSGSVDTDVESETLQTSEVMRQTEAWREWVWTKQLLQLEYLQKAHVTWWDFPTWTEEYGEAAYDCWLAGRMVSDRVMRERMLGQGRVLERSVEVRGAAF